MYLSQKILLLLLLMVAPILPQFLIAQANISFIGTASGPTTNGPVSTPQVITFHKTAATPSSPAIQATFSYTKQNYTTTEDNPTVPALTFGTTSQLGSNSLFNLAIGTTSYDLMNTVSSPSNANFTVCATCVVGTGIDITQNRAVALYNSVDGLIDASGNSTVSLTDKVYMGDLTITFNQPVKNPMMHVVGLGGQFFYYTEIPSNSGNIVNYAHGFTTEYELLTPNISLKKISGNATLAVTSTAITNTATNLGASTNPSLANGLIRQAATGTVQIQGVGITTVTFKVYMRGDAGIIYDKNNVPTAATFGNVVKWSIPKDFVPNGQSDKTNSFSGDRYLIGLSLSECDLVNAGKDTTFCANTTSVDLSDALTGQSWKLGNIKPIGTTPAIGSTNGSVTGLTTAGTYNFIVYNNTTPTCADTVNVILNALPSALTFTKSAPNCTGITANNNGKITLSAVTNGTHYGVSSLGAATYNGVTTIATATPITGTPDVKINIPNTGGNYIIRIFNGLNTCYTDETVTIAPICCQTTCLPLTVTRN